MSTHKQPRRWEKSETHPDGTCKSVEVEEAENGFVIKIKSHNYSLSEEGDNYKSKNYTRLLISKKNPLEKNEPVVETDDDILEDLKAYFGND
jgi:hypothetical protein